MYSHHNSIKFDSVPEYSRTFLNFPEKDLLLKVNILEHSIFKHSEYLFLNPSWKLWDIFENVGIILKPFRKLGTFWLLLTILTLDSQLLYWFPIRSPSFETPSPYSFHTTYSTPVAPNQNLRHHGWMMESYCTTPYKPHEALYGEGGTAKL